MDNQDLIGKEFIDNDSRMNGRRVKVVAVFFNQEKRGRLKPGKWYANTVPCYRFGHEYEGKPYTVSLGNLFTRFRPAPPPAKEDGR